MPVDIYGMSMGGPLRAILTICKLGDIEYNMKEVDMYAQEHKGPEFLKINPEHTVPAMDDNGFHLWESRAIMIYLAEKYSKDKNLYPEDIQKRAKINRLLFFDLEKVSSKIGPVAYAIMMGKPVEAEKETAMKEALPILDAYIGRQGTTYLTGEHVTVADLCIRGSLTYLEFSQYDYSQWKNITAFIETMKKLPCEDIHTKGFEQVKAFQEQMKKNAAAQ